MPIQYCSTLVLWYSYTSSDNPVLQYSGALVLLYCHCPSSSAVLWCSGALVLPCQCQSRATTGLIRRYPFLDPRPQSQAMWSVLNILICNVIVTNCQKLQFWALVVVVSVKLGVKMSLWKAVKRDSENIC